MKKLIGLVLTVLFLNAGCAGISDFSKAKAPPTPPPPKVATQAEMEAGTESATRTVSPLLVAQAINALAAEGVTGIVDATIGAAGNGDTTHTYSKDDIHDYAVQHDSDFDGLPDGVEAGSITLDMLNNTSITAYAESILAAANEAALIALIPSYVNQDVTSDANPSFSTINVVGTNSLNVGTASTNTGQIKWKNSANDNVVTMQSGASSGDYTMTLPTAAPGGSNYLLNMDADGTMGWTDPASVGGAGGVSISGTPSQYEWAEWTDSSTIKGTAVTGSKVVCTDANGSPVACTSLTDIAAQATDVVLDDLAALSLIQGDILFYDGSNLNRLEHGIAGQYLKTGGADANPSWDDPAGSGDITAVGDSASGASFTEDGTGNVLYFEGTTANTFEIALTGANPGADVVVTIPATAGTLVVGPSGFGSDNVLTKTDGTGNLTQATEISVDDSNNLSGAASLAATTFAAVGSDPADAGAIRLDNAAAIEFEASPAGTDVNALTVTSGEVVQIGASGASGVTVTPAATFSNGITNAGTIAAGTWNGTALADAYVANDITLTNITQITTRSFDDITDGSSYQKVAAADVNASSHVDRFYDSDGTGYVTVTGLSTGRAITFSDEAQTVMNIGSAQNISGDKEIQDNVALSLGNDNDWEATYDETTDDRLEIIHAAGAGADVYFDLNDNAADSTYTITNSDGTYEANLYVEGDILAKSVTADSGDGSRKFTLLNNTSGNQPTTANIDTGIYSYETNMYFVTNDSIHSRFDAATGDVYWYGATDDNGFEYQWDLTDPTADRTLTIDDVSVNLDHATEDYVLKYNASTRTWGPEADATGSALGSNLSSATNNVSSDTGEIQLNGTGNTNNEDLDLDFETAANTVGISSDTGVTLVDFGAIGLAGGSFDASDGNISNVGTISLDAISADATNVIFGSAAATQLQFRDSAIHVASLDDGHLDLTADTSIDLNGTVVTSAGIELGNASDTTIARASAGAVMIEGVSITTASNTQTLTNKTLDTAATGNSITVPLNGVLNGGITDPADADDMLYAKSQFAATITDIHCIAEGGGTITLTIQECDSAGANCSNVDAAITCDSDGAEDDGSLTNASVDAGDWVKVLFSAPTGTVNSLSWSVYGTQTW